ncbi:7-carboxy-7-deazaguanine synthase [Nanoarchaeota archaeon]|nr:MAG: 7-carboxy-7-deazaguanine synthase [Nanoarchaeota archaeon]
MAFVYEIFSSIQGEGPLVGKRQIFVRFAGCPLRCYYCDTKYAYQIPKFSIIIARGKKYVRKNPLSGETILQIVKSLETPDLHSISFTGGEPLIQEDLPEILSLVNGEGYRTFLETAGYPSDLVQKIADFVDYASVDIKLPSHKAHKNPREVIDSELRAIKILHEAGAEVYVKIVVTEETTSDEILNAIDVLEPLDIEVILQPVSSNSHISVPIEKLLRISEELGTIFGHEIRILPQVHKLIGLK